MSKPAAPKMKKTFLLKKRITDDIEISKQLQSVESKGSINLKGALRDKLLTKATLNTRSGSLVSIKAIEQEILCESPTSPTITDELIQIPEVNGPQLKLNKTFLSIVEHTGNIATDSLIMTNNGTTAIFYKWGKINIQREFAFGAYDKEDRFFCHAVCY